VIVWRNGEIVDAAAAISAADRGWLIGEALFETVLTDGGEAAFLPQHLERLGLGAAAFGIDVPALPQEIASAIARVSAIENMTGRSVCRMTLTRVGGARGLLAGASATPQLTISVQPAAAVAPFMRLMISTHRKWAGASTTMFKFAGNYAENILARREAAVSGADEAIMLNEHGRVASASSANLFLAEGGRIRTPSVREGAMQGVVRRVLLEEAARLGVNALEGEISPDELAGAVILLTNSVVGVVKCALDESTAPADDVASRLIAAYQRRLNAEFNRETMIGVP
jgi:branched-chain amino acid aminotransferase